jgi:putative thioredoxin
MAVDANVVEVTDANFSSRVLEESGRRPVVVDFWAAWCRPCLLIGPVLERLAGEHRGEFLLAKLDVDSNPQTAAAFRIQSIPAVKAFRDGRLVSEFIGAIPEQSIREWLRSVLPSEADRVAMRGEEAEREGRTNEAADLYSQALAMDPRHEIASLGLGRLAALRGNLEEARQLLMPLRPHPEAERLLAAVEVSEWAAPGGDGQGPLAEAERAAAQGRFADALEGFLREVAAGGEYRDQARESMLKLFSVLGEDDPLTREYRRRLAATLY